MKGRFIDLTGHRYGMLTVIRRGFNRQKTVMWVCRCDCGTIKSMRADYFKNAVYPTCGKHKNKDITGQRIGTLVAISPVDGSKKWGNAVWLCRCDCGNEINLSTSDMLRHKTCGDYKRHPRKDITGLRFGTLTALCPVDNKPWGSALFWKCRCDCGDEIVVSGNHLRFNHTKSCPKCTAASMALLNTTHGLSKTVDYQKAFNRRRKELKRLYDSTWTPLMEISLFAYMPVCVLCGTSNNLSVDHVQPLSKGFGLVPGNAVVLCCQCNSKKKDRDLEKLPMEWKTKILSAAESFRIAWSGGF